MSTDTVRIMCPNLVCRKVLAVPRTARGKTVKCRSCGISIRVPPENHAAKTQAQTPAQDGASKKSA